MGAQGQKRNGVGRATGASLSILFIFRLAAALPHLPHAAMTSMAWNRCISSYRIIPVSIFVLNFHALTRTKLKYMADDHVLIWWRVTTIS